MVCVHVCVWTVHTLFKENPDWIGQAKVISDPEKCGGGLWT